MDLIERLARNVDERLVSRNVDAEVKQWALEQIDAIDTDLDRVVGRNGRKQFIVGYLKREQVRYQADSTADLPDWIDADEVRDDPLCRCSNGDCDIKKARLPTRIDEDRLLEEIRLFSMRHPGYPAALHEGGEEYLRTRARIHSTLRRVYASLGSNEVLDADVDVNELVRAAGAEGDADVVEGEVAGD